MITLAVLVKLHLLSLFLVKSRTFFQVFFKFFAILIFDHLNNKLSIKKLFKTHLFVCKTNFHWFLKNFNSVTLIEVSEMTDSITNQSTKLNIIFQVGSKKYYIKLT